MIEGADIWRSAALLLRQQGGEATMFAAMQADS